MVRCLTVIRSPLRLSSAPPSSPLATPFTVQDLVAMERINDPQPSPDGSKVAFSLTSDGSREEPRQQRPVAGQDRRVGNPQLTSHTAGDFSPRWSGNDNLFFLSSRSGSVQVWRLPLTGGEALQVDRPAPRRREPAGRPRGHVPLPRTQGLSRLQRYGDLHRRAPRGRRRAQDDRHGLRPDLRPPLGHLEGRPAQPCLPRRSR